MPTARRIDLNADLGEGQGDDAAMLRLVSSASIACGGHAGDAETMFAAMSAARDRGVTLGAHPGYPDREGFGRRVLPLSAGQVERMVAQQVGAACGIAALAGTRIAYVKAHGALYNLAAVDPDAARAIARAVRAVDPRLALLCLSGSVAARVSEAAGLAVFAEAFADRALRPDGTLVPRGEPGAVIHDAAAVVARAAAMLATGRVPAVDGTPVPLAADSLCLHGDTPGAAGLAQALRRGLEGAGWTIAAFARTPGLG